MNKKHKSVPDPLGKRRRGSPAGRTWASRVHLPALPCPTHRMPEPQFPYLQHGAKSLLLGHGGAYRCRGLRAWRVIGAR